MITFISKNKNILVDFYNYENQTYNQLEINEESISIIENSILDKFCINFDNKNGNNNDETDIGILIHLLPINNDDKINQNLNMPLIRGISIRQILKKGQIIYYRINENEINSNLINAHFQNVTGKTKVFPMVCDNFPNCDFSLDNIDIDAEQFMINKNMYFNIKIEKGKQDIYHKSEFPVVVVYCTNENEDVCNYYIEMSNDKDTLFLNKDRKIYSFIQSNKEGYNFKFTLSENNINANKQLFIQMTSLIGSTNFIVNDIKYSEDYYHYFNNNTIFFIYDFEKSIDEFNIKVQGETNSYYSLSYYVIDENIEKGRNIFLQSNEVHYSILTKPNVKYYYYFQDKDNNIIKDYYYVTITPINCKLHVSKEDNDYDEGVYNFIINSNEKIKIYYGNDNNIKDICEFTISAMEIFINRNFKNLRETILSDGIFQNIELSKELKFNSAYFYYMISKDEIKNNMIFININKNTDVNLVLEYYINNYMNNQTITNNNQIIEINLNDINLQSSFLQELYNFLIIRVAVHLEKRGREADIDFKIKMNGKNLPSYLNSDEIEYGLINKGNYIYYFLDYYQNEKFQIYFDSKGSAIFKVVYNIDKSQKVAKLPNHEYYNNKYNLPIDKDFEGEKNYNFINIDKCGYEVCQANIIIYISNQTNEKTLFNLYRHSEKNYLKIPFNQEIYGSLKYNIPSRFYSQINFNGHIKIILNCKKCKMCYYLKDTQNAQRDTKCKNPFEPSKDKYILITNDIKDNINKINYVIFSDTQNEDEIIYFSIYVFKEELPKYINQNIPEFCKTPCKLVLPLYQFYHYNQKQIILYVPDDEQTIIYEKIVKMEGSNNLKDFILVNDYDNSSKSSLISNRLIIDVEQIKEKYNENVNMEIQINSKLKESAAKNITFITSQFYNSLNTELIPYFQNIYIINDDIKSNFIEKDIINNLIENNLYKIDIFLIEGSGSIFLNNNKENNQYSLSYDTQERISLILKSNKLSLIPEKNEEEKNLIFYVRVTEKEENIINNVDNEELIFSKTNYLNYFKDNNNSNIFPIKLKLKLDQNNTNDLHINFYFSKLIKTNKDTDSLINVINEKFDIKIFVEHIGNNKNNEINRIFKYNSDIRRGYIYIEKTNIEKQNYIEIIIDKNKLNKNEYEKVSLDITPFDIQEDVELPRNTYLEMKINKKNQKIKLSKPTKEYNNLYLELSLTNNFDLSISNTKYNKKENIYGKNYYSVINNKESEYIMNIISKNSIEIGNILLKYITRKNIITQFNLVDNNITLEKIDGENYSFYLKHFNIKNENKNYSNYKLNYLIRIYNYFSFERGVEPRNILVEEEPLMSFRKELNEKEMENETINYKINFGKLKKSKYYISILGEVINDNNIEYFSYNNFQFIVKTFEKEFNFDFTWLIIIMILLFTLIFTTFFLVKVIIKIRNENDDNTRIKLPK